MANEPALYARMEMRVKDAEKQLAKFGQRLDQSAGTMEKRWGKATKNMDSTMSHGFSKMQDYAATFGKGLWAGLAAGGITGIAAAVQGVTKSFAELGREAQTAGLNVEDFQRWRYVADQNRIGVDALIDGFKELNLRADEYVATGKGSASESFQRLGMSPQDVKERIKDPSAFMLELIDRTRRLKDTAAGVRIFDELLGGQGGEQFVRLIEQGRDGITATINEADRMGAVMDENFIRKAEEVDKKFQQIATTIGSTLKTAIVDAVTALQGFISQWNALNEKSVSGIKAELEVLKQSRERLGTTQEAGGLQDKIAGVFGKDRESQLAAITAQEKLLNDELERRAAIVVKTPDKPPVTPYVPPKTNTGGGGSKKSTADREREASAKAAEREREAVTKLIEELQFEASLVGKTAVEKEKMIALRQAGSAATAGEKAQIESLIDATYREREALDAAHQRALEVNEAAREVTGNLVTGLLSGAKASDVLDDALGNVADRLINDVLDSIFQIKDATSGNWLTSLLGLSGGAGGSSPQVSFTNYKGN